MAPAKERPATKTIAPTIGDVMMTSVLADQAAEEGLGPVSDRVIE